MSCCVTCRMPRRSTPRSLLWWQARREVRVGKPGSFSSLPSENTRKRATEVHRSRPRSKFWKFSGTSIPVLPWSVTDCLCRPYGLRLQKNARLLPVSAPCNSHRYLRSSQVLAVFIHSNCCCEIAPWDTGHLRNSADIWIVVCAKKGRRARSWHIWRKMLLHFLPTISTMGMFKNRAAVVRDIAVFLVRQTSKPVFRTSQHLPQMHWNAITPVFLVHIPQHPQKPWKSIYGHLRKSQAIPFPCPFATISSLPAFKARIVVLHHLRGFSKCGRILRLPYEPFTQNWQWIPWTNPQQICKALAHFAHLGQKVAILFSQRAPLQKDPERSPPSYRPNAPWIMADLFTVFTASWFASMLHYYM